jgi:ribosomal protein S18 acetylase RimI-like enzyme
LIQIRRANYRDAHHANHLVTLLNDYAQDPMGGGEPLSQFVKDNLVTELEKRDAITLLAYWDDRAVGLLNAFEGFSSFYCKPLLNIHDLAVQPAFRGKGIGRMLLAQAEVIARQRGYCKLTLEVLSGNKVAAGLYRQCGFAGYQLDPAQGRAEFWEKTL